MEVDQVAKPSSSMISTGAKGATTTQQKLPFVEKYRPASLNDIISHTEIVQTGKSTILVIPNLLFNH